MEFVELNRCFAQITKDQESNLDIGDIGRLWGRKIAGWLEWNDLLQYRRVVILAEALSGKTEEFRHQASKLADAGKAAFFMRIEDLPGGGVEDALDPRKIEAFKCWQDGDDQGWFFLDSVDEARLNGKNLERALMRFHRSLLDDALGRARVFISCRVSDWKGDDRRVIEEYLPAWKIPASTPTEADEHAALLAPIFGSSEKRTHRSTREPERKTDEPLIVQITPLSVDQRRVLAQAAEVPHVEAFIVAMDQNGLDVFAERPGDLLELAAYWKSNGRFDPLAQMTEHGITRKLSELDTHRSDNNILSLRKARKGAERLAAALTLGKSLILRIPGQTPDLRLTSGALDPVEILDDWTDAERNALIRRGIFAPSTYGRVRFHHRSTQEYLAAKWFERLLAANCPHSEIWDLLFIDCYDVATVVPSLRPVAAWLAMRHPKFRDEIIRREPLVLLRHGDPRLLPLEIKERLLRVYAKKHAKGEIADDSLDRKSLWMFTDAGLADTIRQAWDINEQMDFRIDLLRLVDEGKIVQCIDLARYAALQVDADDYLRIAALRALKQCDDRDGLDQVTRQLMANPLRVSARLASSFASLLYPGSLTTDQLLTLIAESQPVGEFAVAGFAYVIEALYEACLDATSRTDLVSGLAELCLAPPFTSSYQRVSKRFQSLAKHLTPIARHYLRALGDQIPPRSLVRLLMVIERAEHEISLDDGPLLAALVQENAELKRALLWANAEEVRKNAPRQGAPTRYWQIVVGHTRLWHLRQSDLPWLFEDMDERALIDDQQIALSAIVNILRESHQLDDELDRLRALIADRPQLQDDLNSHLAPPQEDEEMRQVVCEEQHIIQQQQEKKEQAKASWVELKESLQTDPSCLWNSERLATGPGVNDLLNLTCWLQHRTKAGREEKAVLEWRLLEEAFGSEIAEAYRDGMKAVWRLKNPERPKREADGKTSVKWTTILSFAGIAIEAADNPEWISSLSDAKALRAMQHGCMSERGYPNWVDALVTARPQVVLPILRQTLAREWKSGREGCLEFLSHYAHSALPIQPVVQKLLFETMIGPEPADLDALDKGLGILQQLNNLSDDDCHRIAKLARRRMRRHTQAGSSEYALRYLALLLLMDTDCAIRDIAAWLDTAEDDARHKRTEHALGLLFGRRNRLAATALDRASASGVEALLRLVYRYIRPEDDVVHQGSYEPNERDYAQDARNIILMALHDKPGAEAYRAVLRLSEDPLFRSRAMRFRELARGKAENDAEPPPWSVAEMLNLERQHTAPIKRGEDLFRVVIAVLKDIRLGFLNDDASSRRVLTSAEDECAVQNWLAEQLRLREPERFHVSREVEVAGNKKPDIIVSSTAASYEVAIEVKHANMGWTVRQLEDALRKQLAGDYLRPASRRHGLLVITLHGKRTWRHPQTKCAMSFADLLSHLTEMASALVATAAGSFDVRVIDIDASSS